MYLPWSAWASRSNSFTANKRGIQWWVAFSFWAALAGRSILGIRYPLAMLPVIFMQLFYKPFWLLAVYVPLRAAGRSTEPTQGMLIGIVLDIIVIPWSYVFAHYMKEPGDRWR